MPETEFYLQDSPEEKEDKVKTKKKPVKKQEQKGINLYTGEELSTAETRLVTYRHKTTLILIVGEYDSGKTTFLATYLERFQQQPFEDFLFAGSTTLIGFERRCHLSRLSSNLNKPKTPKTPSTEFSFLHLAVKQKSQLEKGIMHLLISDVSGERIKRARNSSSEMKQLSLLKRADYIIVMIDGEKLADKKLRYQVILEAQTFLKMALDVNVIGAESNVNVIISKWDKIHSDDSFNYQSLIKTPFETRFAQLLNRLEFSEVASRPEADTDEIKDGFGLEPLLSKWCTEQKNTNNPIMFTKTSAGDLRYFNNYHLK
ncbi:MAG: hypothetical protein V4620_03300 [Bacteroidota bacterium]